jgi:8-oxo-dGTP diphosphatase
MDDMKHVVDHAIVDVLVIRDGKYLLVQESKPGREGRYNLPGGHVDGHETLFEAACREVAEESGYDVELTGLVGIYQGIYEHLNVSGPVFCARVVGGAMAASKNHPDVRWVTRQELEKMAATGQLFTTHPPIAVDHYESRGPLSLDMVYWARKSNH